MADVRFNYEEAIERLLEQWRNYHQQYIKIIPRYRELLVQKRVLKIPLKKIKETEIKQDFPKIFFLAIDKEKDVKEFILDMTPTEIMEMIAEIDILTNNNHVWRKLNSWIKEAEYEIRHYGVPKTYVNFNKDKPIKNKVPDYFD